MSNSDPILVTGAAGGVGSVGRWIVTLLREVNLPVRALVHRVDERSQELADRGAEVVVGDLNKGADIVSALKGCRRMYFGMSLSPTYLQATVLVAAAAKEIPNFEPTLPQTRSFRGGLGKLSTNSSCLDGRESHALQGRVLNS